MSSKAGLLRLGVTQYPPIRSSRPFDMGGLGVLTSTRPFDIEQLPITVHSIRPFDISGATAAYSTRPFDLLGALRMFSIRPFDIIENIPAPVPGAIIPGAPSTVSTTLSSSASAGDLTVQVTSGTGISVGSVISIGGEIRTVVSIS